MSGDGYDLSAPSEQAQQAVVQALLRMRRAGAARSDGADTQVAVLPFLSQRYAVRAAEIVANTPSENVRAYDEQVRQVIGSLTGGFGGTAIGCGTVPAPISTSRRALRSG